MEQGHEMRQSITAADHAAEHGDTNTMVCALTA